MGRSSGLRGNLSCAQLKCVHLCDTSEYKMKVLIGTKENNSIILKVSFNGFPLFSNLDDNPGAKLSFFKETADHLTSGMCFL